MDPRDGSGPGATGGAGERTLRAPLGGLGVGEAGVEGIETSNIVPALPSAAPTSPATRVPAPASAGGTTAWLAADPAVLTALGLDRIPLPVRLASEVVVTTGGVAMAMSFFVFGKRRRDEEPPAPDGVLRSAASTPPDVSGHAYLADGMLNPTPARGVDPGIPPEEVGMPRWRRPSLMEARRADPTRTALAASEHLTFDRGSVGPLDGYERRLLRYRLVRLLDQPDELRGNEIGVLDQGDEVQLLQRSGAYWLVLAPDGSRGWLHRMTLGATVGAPEADAAAAAAARSSALAAEDEEMLVGDVRHERAWVPVGS